MPEISRFLGIVVVMFMNDHPPPHFHAFHGEYEIMVDIQDGLVTGQFPSRAVRHVLEWLDLHRDELMDNWNRCRRRQPIHKIAPLE